MYTINQKDHQAEEEVDLEVDEKPAKSIKPANPKPSKQAAAKSAKKDEEKGMWANKAECEEAEAKLQERLAQVCQLPCECFVLVFNFIFLIFIESLYKLRANTEIQLMARKPLSC